MDTYCFYAASWPLASHSIFYRLHPHVNPAYTSFIVWHVIMRIDMILVQVECCNWFLARFCEVLRGTCASISSVSLRYIASYGHTRTYNGRFTVLATLLALVVVGSSIFTSCIGKLLISCRLHSFDVAAIWNCFFPSTCQGYIGIGRLHCRATIFHHFLLCLYALAQSSLQSW